MSDVRKSDMWVIEYKAVLTSEVQFCKALTEEEAKQAFLRGDYYDIIDEEVLSVRDVLKMEDIPE